jgi:hypothetical protein
MKNLIRKILKEETEGFLDSTEEDFEWTKDNNPLDALDDDDRKNRYVILRKLMKDYGLTETEALKVMAKYEHPRNRFKHEYDEDTTYWVPGNASSTFQFNYPPKWNSLTRKFIDWIRWNPGGTKREFFVEVLGKTQEWMDTRFQSHSSQFFGSMKDSGIIKMERNGNRYEYFLGPNYDAWTKGNLKRYMGMSTPARFNRSINH